MNRWLVGARLRTLPAAVVPVAVGTAAVVGNPALSHGIIWWRALAALLVSLALQVATNYVNDYADGDRGTDDDRVGPARLVGSGLATSSEVKRAAGAAFLVAGIAGIALAAAVGPELLLVGALSMAAGWAYTGGPNPYGYLGLGELFVFVFFGIVATVGSAYVQLESVDPLASLVAVPVGLLAVALLVINNLRDIEGDAASGKRTLSVRIGDRRTRLLYVGLFVAIAVGIVLAALSRPLAAIGLFGLVLAVAPSSAVMAGAKAEALIPILGKTGQLQLVVGMLLTVGLAL